MLSVTTIRFGVGHETLEGAIVAGASAVKPNVLFLHGAGKATMERARPLAIQLAYRGFNSFAFDFSGHGQSTGALEESSLEKRTQEALGASQFLSNSRPLAVCGFSMGGHIALELMKTFPVDNLFLFAPAIFDAAAFSVPFNQGFTQIIRQDESWRNSTAVNVLEQFEGGLLICIGSEDKVIPSGVVEILYAKAQRVRFKEILHFAHVDHQITSWLGANPDAMGIVVEKIVQAMS